MRGVRVQFLLQSWAFAAAARTRPATLRHRLLPVHKFEANPYEKAQVEIGPGPPTPLSEYAQSAAGGSGSAVTEVLEAVKTSGDKSAVWDSFGEQFERTLTSSGCKHSCWPNRRSRPRAPCRIDRRASPSCLPRSVRCGRGYRTTPCSG